MSSARAVGTLKDRAQPLLLLAGLSLCLELRLLVSGGEGPASVLGGVVFGVLLLGLSFLGGERVGRPRLVHVLAGVAGALFLCVGPVVSASSFHAPRLSLVWAGVVSLVAVGEECFLRGAVWRSLEDRPVVALLVSTLAFALLHAPLYGWQVLPLDVCAGLLLGALRLLTRSVTAPATCHALADLATWWIR